MKWLTMDRSVRCSLLHTMDILKQNNKFMTIKELCAIVGYRMNKFIDKRGMYANIKALIEFHYPILVEVRRSNERAYKWDTDILDS